MTVDLRALLTPWPGYRRKPNRYTPLLERLASAIDYQGDDKCWLWMASRNTFGYGRVRTGDETRNTHRVVYELLVGPIPDGLVIDHLCRNPPCCNPAHLEPVTMRENTLRGESPPAIGARRTHCPRGHAYTPENTRLSSSRRRHCRACNREWMRARLDEVQ